MSKDPSACLLRTRSVNDPQESVLEAIKSGNHQFLSDLLIETEIDVNKIYTNENSKRLIEVAVSLEDADSVRLLLTKKADVNLINPVLKLFPVHIAARKGNLIILKHLIDRGNADVNAISTDGKTALHIITKKLSEASNGNESSKYLGCLKYLLASRNRLKLKIDCKDYNGITALGYLASSNTKNIDGITALLQNGADPSNNLANSETIPIRDVLSNLNPIINGLLKQGVDDAMLNCNSDLTDGILDEMFTLLEEAHLRNDNSSTNNFERSLKNLTEDDLNTIPVSGKQTLIQRASELGLSHHVKLLLNAGGNPNITGIGRENSLISACKHGYPEVVECLVKKVDLISNMRDKGDTVLIAILRKPMSLSLGRGGEDHVQKEYEKCLNIILNCSERQHDLMKIINIQDELGNTALHYATQLWPQAIVTSLLELGANIGLKNNYGEIPVHKILPETLEDFLNDHCMKSKGNVANKDFAITAVYDFLAPPISYPSNISTKGSIKIEEDPYEKVPLPETEVLWHMSQSKNHRHLLKHPVITSFLWMKWKLISGPFYQNLLFYSAFVICLTWYVFGLFSGKTIRNDGILVDSNKTCSSIDGIGFQDLATDLKVLWYFLIVSLIILTIREIIQLGVAPRRYFFSPENWLEVFLIGLTATLIISGLSPGCFISLKRHIGAIAIVLSWFELITMIARHPKLNNLNIYCTMFYRVLRTFIVFLIWYSFFIIAFGLGFYILLHKDDGSEKPENDYYEFFDSLGLTIIKTFTMFVGELEFGDLPISSSIGYAYLLSFIFLIVVVMMNLLNGLAVSDTGVIREEAEIHSYICQVEVISYIEAMLLGDPFNFLSNWPSYVWLRGLPNCSLGHSLYQIPPLRSFFHKITRAREIVLFYDRLPSKSITFHPNQESNNCCCCICGRGGVDSNHDFHPSILESAKSIVIAKAKASEGLQARLSRIENSISSLESEFKLYRDISNKLDLLLIQKSQEK